MLRSLSFAAAIVALAASFFLVQPAQAAQRAVHASQQRMSQSKPLVHASAHKKKNHVLSHRKGGRQELKRDRHLKHPHAKASAPKKRIPHKVRIHKRSEI